MFNIWIVRPLINETRDYCARVKAEGGEVVAPYATDTLFKKYLAENIWNSLDSSCNFIGITFPGCFVPIRNDMPIPDNVGPFVEGDHNVVTGLKGRDTNYINLNYNNATAPLNDQAIGVYVTERAGQGESYIGALGATSANSSVIQVQNVAGGNNLATRSRSATGTTTNDRNDSDLHIGISRSQSSEYILRAGSFSDTIEVASVGAADRNLYAFARNNNGTADAFSTARLAIVYAGLSVGASIGTIQTAFATDVAQEAS